MADFTMTIGGRRVVGSAFFPVINPATGALVGQAPRATSNDLDGAMAAARHAYVAWRKDASARRAAMHQAARALVDAADEIAAVLTAEQGKPLPEAQFEARAAGGWFEYYADLELPRDVIQDDDEAFVEVLRRPLGVIAAITPWNIPLAIGARKVAPALRAGNTVVLKPSPYTPLSTLMIGEVLRAVLPPGVFNVISGDDELGRAMTEHEIPRKITFTGSVATGKNVAVAAALDLKRVTLELGGNDAAIVLDDADPAKIAEGIFRGSFANNGQVCAAIKRVYAPRRLYRQVVDALADQAQSAKVGDGMEPTTQLGPINNRPQLERIQNLVEDALQNGGTVASGGRSIDRVGNFYEPTIICDVTDGDKIVDEEQFGPALPIVLYDDVDDALQRANASKFGLSGSVWGADLDRAAAVAEQLDCGTAWVNTHMAFARHQPFAGAKWSGIGVENGTWGLLDFTQIHVLRRPPLGRSPQS